MTKRRYHDPVLTKPLPSTAVPTMVILVLLAALILGNRYFFGAPQRLLGGPPPKNEYRQYLKTPRPKPLTPVVQPAPTPLTTPAAGVTSPEEATSPQPPTATR